MHVLISEWVRKVIGVVQVENVTADSSGYSVPIVCLMCRKELFQWINQHLTQPPAHAGHHACFGTSPGVTSLRSLSLTGLPGSRATKVLPSHPGLPPDNTLLTCVLTAAMAPDSSAPECDGHTGRNRHMKDTGREKAPPNLRLQSSRWRPYSLLTHLRNI